MLQETTKQKPSKKGKTMTMKRKSKKPACPEDEFTVEFAKELVTYLGGDSSKIDKEDDCWDTIRENFPNLIPKIKRYFEEAKAGNVPLGAYYLSRYCKVNPKWAMKVIENSTTGDIAWAAYRLSEDCRGAKRWYKRKFES